MMGGCALRAVSGNVTQFENMDYFLNATWVEENPDQLRYDDCDSQVCEYGLKQSAQVMCTKYFTSLFLHCPFVCIKAKVKKLRLRGSLF